jgi:hypothetical protein
MKGDVGVGGCEALGGASVLPPPIREIGRRSMDRVDLGWDSMDLCRTCVALDGWCKAI